LLIERTKRETRRREKESKKYSRKNITGSDESKAATTKRKQVSSKANFVYYITKKNILEETQISQTLILMN
jgi:hypothetical protein